MHSTSLHPKGNHPWMLSYMVKAFIFSITFINMYYVYMYRWTFINLSYLENAYCLLDTKCYNLAHLHYTIPFSSPAPCVSSLYYFCCSFKYTLSLSFLMDFWLSCIFVAVQALPVAEGPGYSLAVGRGLLSCSGFSCSTGSQGRAQAQ